MTNPVGGGAGDLRQSSASRRHILEPFKLVSRLSSGPLTSGHLVANLYLMSHAHICGQVSSTEDFETRKAVRARLQQIKSEARGKSFGRRDGWLFNAELSLSLRAANFSNANLATCIGALDALGATTSTNQLKCLIRRQC